MSSSAQPNPIQPRSGLPRSRDTETAWHALDPGAALAALHSGTGGLTSAEARARIERVGPNVLRAAKPTPRWQILVAQFRSVVVALLAAATAAALIIGDPLEAAAVAAVLVINTTVGFVTELRARRAMEALQRFEVHGATVLRDGHRQDLDVRELVPGDVVFLEEGLRVPADMRLLQSKELQTDESILTGESQPRRKNADATLDPGTVLGDRDNLLYRSTMIAAGAGLAVVFATGMSTEIGRIGRLLASIRDESTPLEERLDVLGRRLVWLTLGVAAVVIALGLLRRLPGLLVVETGIALAIAAVPEGLPAVATITLAFGLRRMARRNALIRRLPAVETLGSTTVVCTDKTGTLTSGSMTATRLWAAGHVYRISGVGLDPEGEVSPDRGPGPALSSSQLNTVLRPAALANRADFVETPEGWSARGDPSEVALLVLAHKCGLDRQKLLEAEPEIGELPFTSARRLMATFHRAPAGTLAYVKGSPERLLALSTELWGPERARPLNDASRADVLEANRRFAEEGLRVLALAVGTAPTPGRPNEDVAIGSLTFLGLVGISDPPAAGVQETVERFRQAGVQTVVITGDQSRTAQSVARQLGIVGGEAGTLDGRELAALGSDDLRARVGDVRLFSRVSPEDKLRIVSAFQDRGEIVAMLGDGVNDAAALRKAQIGVAMGKRGADIAKEASDVVLLDDRFETIGVAIEEGRIVFDNIQKFVFYLFSCNLAEVLVLLISGAVGLPLPLRPLQLLWLNLVTDTFPALSLAVEPADPNVMERPPRRPREAIISRLQARWIGFYATAITVATLFAFVAALQGRAWGSDPTTLAFATLALAQIMHLGNARSGTPVLRPGRAFANPWALGAVAVSAALTVASVQVPFLQRVLETHALPWEGWILATACAAVPALGGQLTKLVRKRPG